MFDKIVYRVMMTAVCSAVVGLCSYIVHTVVHGIQEDKRLDKMMDDIKADHDRRNAIIEEALTKSLRQEAQ